MIQCEGHKDGTKKEEPHRIYDFMFQYEGHKDGTKQKDETHHIHENLLDFVKMDRACNGS